jgi:omega-6 fatty acid desaturase (delta-12 desaturase)
MGVHYRSDTSGGSLGFLKSLWTSARWCQWVEPSAGAIGEGKGVYFFRNHNGLGTKPLKLKEVKPAVGNAKMGMVFDAK